MVTTNRPRKKAWIGAAIAAGVSLLGSIGGGLMKKNAEQKNQKRATIAQNRADTYEMAQNLTAGYGDQSYLDRLNERVTFSHGGSKRRACGGKVKKEAGGSSINTTDIINGVSSALNNLSTNAIDASIIRNKANYNKSFFSNTAKDELVVPGYYDRLQLMKCGGKKVRK